MSHLINTADPTLLSSLLDNQEDLEWSAYDIFTTTSSQHPDRATLSFTEESFTNIDTSLDFLQGIENLQYSSNPQIQELFEQQEATLDAAMEVDSNWDLDELSLLLDLPNCSTEGASAASKAQAATKAVPLAEEASLPKSTTQLGHIPLREMKNPVEKEDFVHPGFYSLPASSVATPTHSACASPFTPHALPPMPSGRKRPLRDEDLMEVVLASQHSYGHSHRQHHLAHAALANRRHSFDTAPPSSSVAGSSAGKSSLAQHLLQQQQQQQGTGVPPGQPFVAACSSPNGGSLFAEYLASFSQLGQIQFSPSTRAGRGTATSSTTSSSLSFSPNGRKRRSSKFKMEAGLGGYSESFIGSSPYGSPLLGPRLVQTQVSNSYNALPPPLQQHRSQPNQHPLQSSPFPLLQHHPRPSHPHVQTKSSGSSRHGQSASISSSSSSSTSSSSPPGGGGGSSHQRRNPAEVSASTLPPDHFIFKEAMMGLNRQSLDGGCLNMSAYTSSTATGSSNRHNSTSTTPRMTATQHRRRSEPINSHSKSYNYNSSPSSEKGIGSGEQRSRTISPLDAFSEGTEASIRFQKRLSGGNDLPYHHLFQQQQQQQQKQKQKQQQQQQQQAYHPYLHKLMTPPRSVTSASQSPSLPSQGTTSLVDALNGTTVSKTVSKLTLCILGQQRGEGEEKKEEQEEDGAAFAQSLLMLDPITTKLMDQLRLQEYLRSEQAQSDFLASTASVALSDQDKGLNMKNGTTLSTESAEAAAVAVATALAVSPPHTPSSEGE